MTTRDRKAVGPPTVGQKLRAQGAEVDLGGSMVRLRLDWGAVELLEQQWGSLRAWGEALQGGSNGPMFKAIGDGIAACAPELPVPAKSLMDLGRFEEYADGLQAALMESGMWKEDGDQGNPNGAETSPPPGNGSSISTSSASASALSSSGA